MAWETVRGSRLSNEFRRRAIHYLQSNGVDVTSRTRNGELLMALSIVTSGSIPKTRREKYRFYINELPPAPEEKLGSDKEFYCSREWREVRYLALVKHSGRCQCCGRRPPEIVIHVDHIKPRSKYPELELELSNLQLLCEDCNLGKSNKDQTDWRNSSVACAETGSATVVK